MKPPPVIPPETLARVVIAAALSVWGTAAPALDICSGPNRAERKVTCLVDGDTGWENGVKWRLEGADTPEYPPLAACPLESEMAKTATYRLLELMQEGYEIEWLGEKDRTREKRDLVWIRLADGREAGSVLVEEGLASLWPHRPRYWCPTLRP